MVKARKKLRLALITNARSDYTTIYPVMQRSLADSEIDARIVCAGMHLQKKFGSTWRQLEKDGIPIHYKLPYFEGDDSNRAMGLSLGKGARAFTRLLDDIQPDYVVLSGDRIENMAVYSATLALNLPVAHLCGGDITEGSRDNQVRHMMTKLSHLHFVSMELHRQRVRQMGEEDWRIHISGDAALDAVVALKAMNREELWKAEKIPAEREFCMCTFHPCTLGGENDEQQVKNLLEFLADVDNLPVVVYPNIDPGHDRIIRQLERFKKRRPDAIMRHNFSRNSYYALMTHAEFIIGNTSAGLWEGPSFKLPAINIGLRQAGRLRAGNVVDISGLDPAEFPKALKTIRSSRFRAQLSEIKNPYGDGRAAEMILKVLKQTPVDDRLLMKGFVEHLPMEGK